MLRVVFFIDGFNLYHSIVNPKFPGLHHFKWLNLKLLCSKFIRPAETLKDVYYFTSICSWDKHKAERHKKYIKVLKDTGVKVVYGKFKEVSRRCRAACRQEYKTHEEKRTDVSIGIKLLSLAAQNEFDIAYIVSGDSDLVPAVEEVKILFPDKKIFPIFPYGKGSLELKEICKQSTRIKEFHMSESQFPNPVTLSDGNTIECPTEWKESATIAG